MKISCFNGDFKLLTLKYRSIDWRFTSADEMFALNSSDFIPQFKLDTLMGVFATYNDKV